MIPVDIHVPVHTDSSNLPSGWTLGAWLEEPPWGAFELKHKSGVVLLGRWDVQERELDTELMEGLLLRKRPYMDAREAVIHEQLVAAVERVEDALGDTRGPPTLSANMRIWIRDRLTELLEELDEIDSRHPPPGYVSMWHKDSGGCPRCDSPSIARWFYNVAETMLPWGFDLWAKRGGTYGPSSPEWHCHECGLDFGDIPAGGTGKDLN
jgi:hypothetical protein